MYKFLINFCLLLVCSAHSAAELSQLGQTDFVRHNKHLEAAIAKFENNSGVRVDLVSALHVADKRYYQELNERFKGYDAVLFELVADERVTKTRQLPRQEDSSAVSMVQGGLSQILDLSFQLDEVDYTPNNFVHADLSPAQFAENMSERGETTLGTLIKILAASKRSSEGQGFQETLNSINLIRLLMKPDTPERAKALKRAFASEFEKMGDVLEDLSGGGGTTLLEGRNNKALEVLREQIKAGKKKLAIFYGGAHLPDMAEKLEKIFGFTHTETEWIVAWDLSA